MSHTPGGSSGRFGPHGDRYVEPEEPPRWGTCERCGGKAFTGYTPRPVRQLIRVCTVCGAREPVEEGG